MLSSATISYAAPLDRIADNGTLRRTKHYRLKVDRCCAGFDEAGIHVVDVCSKRWNHAALIRGDEQLCTRVESTDVWALTP